FHSMPPKSPKYTAPPTTAGVAETSPAVVATHFGARRLTFAGPIVFFSGALRLLTASLPIIPQSGPPPTTASVVDALVSPASTVTASAIERMPCREAIDRDPPPPCSRLQGRFV